MKKIINPWKGMDGYYCFGCAPNNEAGVKMEFYEDGDDIGSKISGMGKHTAWWNTSYTAGRNLRMGDSKKASDYGRNVENGNPIHEIHNDY